MGSRPPPCAELQGKPLDDSEAFAMTGTPQVLISREFFQLAVEFYTAYQILPETPPPSWPRYFMMCHSAELALKAFLAWHGKSIAELKKNKFGHDLNNLCEEAANCGLIIEPTALREIKLLHEAHKKMWPRYPKEDANHVFVIEQFEASVSSLIQQVGRIIFGNQYMFAV